jgi:phosphosulfolactate synthase (CoM biosynthesis protein A)
MRSVLSISIPPKKLAALKKRAKNEGMTISAYVIQKIDDEENMISEEELLEDIRQNRKDIAAGKFRIMGPGDTIEDFLPLDA